MKKFNLQHWWNLIAAAGAVIAVALFTVQLMHGSREPNVVGLVLDVFGIGLFGIGLFAAVFAP